MIKFVDFKKHVAEGKLKPVYAFIGEDAFLVKSAVGMLEKKVDFPQMNVTCFGDSSEIGEMVAAYSQLPMMSEYRLMKCEVKEKSPNELRVFLDYARRYPNPQTIVAFTSSELISGLAANVGSYEIVDCARLDKPMILKWLAARSAAVGASIDREAAGMLADYCLNNLTRIEVEFDKLVSIADGKIIDCDMVSENVAAEGDFKIYELSDALAKREVERTYRIYGGLIVATPPVVILGTLYSHFRRLLYAATSKFERDILARYMRVKPFAMEMAARHAKLYTPRKLKRIVDRLSAIDVDFKSGRVNDRLALDTFIAEMLVGGVV